MAKRNTADMRLASPRDIMVSLMKATSGAEVKVSKRISLFYRRIAFKGADLGVGCSTLVSNVALCLAKLGLKVLVIDTSMLHPIQDVLLNTKRVDTYAGEEVTDWFDLPYTKGSVLNVSTENRGVFVLGFSGKHRTVVDMLSMKDNKELLDLALQRVEKNFDIVLFDLCDEVTEINTYCMQTAQRVIQVWSNTRGCIENMDRIITNNVLLSCQMDKMRQIVECKMVTDTIGNLNALYKQYGFNKIASCSLSYEIARISSLDKLPFQYPSNEESVIEYTNCILDICSVLCNITKEDTKKGTITTEDIREGRVEGTMHKAIKDAPKADVIKPESLDDEAFEVENRKRGFSFRKGVNKDA